jgi:hypothetical protein
MPLRIFALVLVAVLSAPGVALGLQDPAKGSTPPGPLPTPAGARSAVARGLTFLEADAVKWRKERGCSTCHHGMLTIWALSEAKAQGYPINEPALAEFIAWAKPGRIPAIDAPRETRPGWRLVSQPAVYLAMASHNLPILSRDEVHRVAVHLAQRQEEDGAYELPPHANAPPPVFFESREVIALFALLAWERYDSSDPKETARNQASRQKTLDWLRRNPTTGTTQALALRLLLDLREGKREAEVQPRLGALLKRQNPDGGWGQEAGMASDAYATGQALYVLSFAGLQRDRPEVQRAIAFLVSTQRPDGSWAVTPRNYPEVDWKRTGLAMNYFGSAWAERGLARLVPPPPDTPAKRQAALDMVRGFHGKVEVEETTPDRPVVRVDLRYYDDLDDGIVKSLVEALQAFPGLAALQLKSPKITDAGLAHLRGLPQLRRLTVENAPVTDAGLAYLKALARLEEVTLKGTRVTDAGLEELRKALPGVRVER